MANLVFRKIGAGISGGDDIWLRSTPASTILTNEFFGVPSGGTVSGYIKYWTGSAWVAKPMKYWTGSAWVQKPVKYWTGTTWALTSYPA